MQLDDLRFRCCGATDITVIVGNPSILEKEATDPVQVFGPRLVDTTCRSRVISYNDILPSNKFRHENC